ncbi:MAG TPA: hypothetical protein DEP66_05015, partial [Acidimicrobiaceae bacterium]|nr:hypothetical protein [Acidimicrobiaceae bacterium]
MTTGGEYTPAQRRTLDAIRLPADQRPSFPAGLADEIHERLDARLAEPAALLLAKSDDLWITKRALAGVNSCEGRYLADEEAGFEWSVPTARGTVFHRAAEFWATADDRPEPAPEFVDIAIAHYIENYEKTGDRLGEFLQSASAGDLAELRSFAKTMLVLFADSFPPIGRGWNLQVEVPRRHLLCDGNVTMSGKYDLALGRPDATADGGASSAYTAGRTIVDLKTGRRSPFDADDAHFYALLETLVTNVPPMLVGTFYVAEGRAVTEQVTTDLLWAAVERTVAGAERLVELRHGEAER